MTGSTGRRNGGWGHSFEMASIMMQEALSKSKSSPLIGSMTFRRLWRVRQRQFEGKPLWIFKLELFTIAQVLVLQDPITISSCGFI